MDIWMKSLNKFRSSILIRFLCNFWNFTFGLTMVWFFFIHCKNFKLLKVHHDKSIVWISWPINYLSSYWSFLTFLEKNKFINLLRIIWKYFMQLYLKSSNQQNLRRNNLISVIACEDYRTKLKTIISLISFIYKFQCKWKV